MIHTGYHRHHDEHRHQLTTTPGSAIRQLVGQRTSVNSLHHQAVDRPGHGMRITAVASDGTAEAIESDDGVVLGVQWRPELQVDDKGVFAWLVRRAGEVISQRILAS